ncbi:hypothetical protein [Spirulina major]|uniref:hypothetical protein n=1 Tax=Spirulina major TaxID=270636 RepID=UPI001587F44B|nr:hypothetical protein [Spirulina major]
MWASCQKNTDLNDNLKHSRILLNWWRNGTGMYCIHPQEVRSHPPLKAIALL